MKMILFTILSVVLMGCQPDVVKPAGKPSNLQTQLTITNGEVHVQATADRLCVNYVVAFKTGRYIPRKH